ncbi:hypothetical protein DXG03_000464 [Asterophora parasitica]|uniref:Sodium/calcium exchanger membrane region domain-containing protein n=1 Tax=Asterophora parasitica TaxID=117018 RepID=A0A9P7GBD3_9AGAR|nr:hypothetical protein DXG03_000464 [Asterophora parasitica]
MSSPASRYAIQDTSLQHGDSSLVKRVSYELLNPDVVAFSNESERQCRPLAFDLEDQCSHVQSDCPTSDTFLSIQYLRYFYCASTPMRPVAFGSLLVWIIFLFSTLGITASDFFTPNLATIAQLLGLDENVTGVTFLAFGNGSPDMFSTFSAMRANSGSLAIGELLGAASFIVSSRNASPTPSTSSHVQLPSFSLVGALEFRQVVQSLQRDAAGATLNMFESTVTPFAGGHYHTHPASRQRTPKSSVSSNNPWDSALALNTRGRSRSSHQTPPHSPTISEQPGHMLDSQSSDYFRRPLSPSTAVPSIIRTSASTVSEGDTESQIYIPPTRKQRVISQSILGQIASIFATPAVMFLTLTLPVVVTPYQHSNTALEKLNHHGDGRLIDFEEEGEARVLIAEEEVLEDLHEMTFNKWLTAAQCALAPVFCVAVLFNGTKHIVGLLIGSALGGFAAAALVAVFADKGDHPTAKVVLSSMGFLVAMVWIMAIADEVVNVLQTFGFMFGLSDAIIGLTIFAVGNSLADLVANMSVAVFAPIMGFSACFGGPMLNILLGVGVSGTYIIQQTGVPYSVHFSTTLLVSTIGLLILLLSTLVFVPLNDYFLTRRWGILLIASYTIIMSINVVVELKSESRQF